MEFLPTKVAHKEKVSMTTMMQRPNLQELVKEAMEGTASKVDISAEAARQLANVGVDLPEQSKTASAASPDTVPTEYVHKLADALEFMAKQAEEGTTSIKPGSGPNALKVEEATSSETNVDAGEQGQAKATVPMTPPMQNSGVAKDAPTAMESNDDMQHAEQPVDPMGNEKSAALFESNLAVLGLTKEALGTKQVLDTAKAVGSKLKDVGGRGKELITGSRLKGLKQKHQTAAGIAGRAKERGAKAVQDKAQSIAARASREAGTEGSKVLKARLGAGAAGAAGLGGAAALYGGKDKKASILARNFMALGLYKQAEDALSPAQISAGGTQTGATPPEGASASEEQVPSEPSDVNKQKNLVSTNESAINYTKREAKADPKSDAGKVLDEPALSASTDKTLQKTLDHTQQAGAKIASDMMKAAAAQAILSKLAEEASAEADEKKKKAKEKQSQGMSGLSDPSGQSGFTATSV